VIVKRDKQRLVRPIGLALPAVGLGLFAGPVAAAGIDRLVARVDRLRDVAYAGWLWTISADDGPPLPNRRDDCG